MKKFRFTTKKMTLISLAVSAGLVALAIWVTAGRSVPPPNLPTGDSSAPSGSEEKFDYLAGQSTNACSLQGDSINQQLAGGRIQGSCCSAMDLHAYQGQIEALKQYADISEIPSDPYDISVEQAQLLLSFKSGISLTAEQEQIYKEAAEISEEGGPCCCKCWHWDAYEGLAKKMIADYGWNAEQVSELWDLSSACGGPGEEHG